MYEMISRTLSFKKSLKNVQFFEKIFMLTKTSIKMVFQMPFLFFNNIDVMFNTRELNWKKYTIAKVMPTARSVDLMNKYQFIEASLNKALTMFIVYMNVLEDAMSIIKILRMTKRLFATIEQDKPLTEIAMKYTDIVEVLSSDLRMELSYYSEINKYAIKLIEGKSFCYNAIYSLNPVKLETVKIYIETYLKTEFIYLFKPLIETRKLFNKKLDRSSRLYVNYQGLKNCTIKNYHLLPLIKELLNRLR